MSIGSWIGREARHLSLPERFASLVLVADRGGEVPEVDGSDRGGFAHYPRMGNEPFAVPTVQLKARGFVDRCRMLGVQVQVQLIARRRADRHECRPDGRLDRTVQVAGH